eukprot:scaffold121045_cov54-Phaeocystis_antarctica.AAC.4
METSRSRGKASSPVRGRRIPTTWASRRSFGVCCRPWTGHLHGPCGFRVPWDTTACYLSRASFGSGLSSVIPFCHRIPITHGATSTTPSTREVAHERQEIDNAASVSRGTQRPVIYLGRECAASVTSYPPPP